MRSLLLWEKVSAARRLTDEESPNAKKHLIHHAKGVVPLPPLGKALGERPFRRHLERSEAESKFAKWSVRNGANRANKVSERSKNDYR